MERRYYDVDPRRNFALGAGVSLETALTLVRLLENGRIQFGEYNEQWRELQRHFGEFVVTRVEARRASFALDSGRHSVIVIIEGTGDAAYLRLAEAPLWGCVES